MKINRNNYEEFIIDYYDGTLNPDQVSELFHFLKLNPDIKEEFDSFEHFSIMADENLVFENKESLKKKDIIAFGSINASNYEKVFIADMERDLTEQESKEIIAFLDINPHLAETFHLFKLTKVKPDTSIVYENKENLKKKEIIIVGSINQTNYENFFIADLENDLTAEESLDLKHFLTKNAHLHKEYDLIKKTILVPDTAIVFENKDALKKFIIAPAVKKKSYPLQYISLAASILLLIGLFFLINNNKPVLTADNSPLSRKLFDYSSNNRIYNINSDKNNVVINYSDNHTSKHKDNNIINTLHPAIINHIPTEADNQKEIIAFRNDEPITFNNYLLADNTNLPKNNNSESVTIKEFLISKFRKKVNQSDEDLNQPSDRLTVWDFAQAGVAGINKLTKSDLQLKKDETNPDNSYALIGKNFSISRNYSK